ncbi:uncharacterized protein RAG0_03454 [Rhynchosporium agropyri]|uniref:ASX DEUBAD domain-containing protein n=1 Tax=Rhynchosporium agropyri TaxID=914238 RepID=A0A1E1K4E3_9HELO|nr:uncharacterized protein RAG0_03454 [Rhynchosporium agropyri]
MSTNGAAGRANGIPNGLTNGYGIDLTNGNHSNRFPPPSRPSSPAGSTTPRVLLDMRRAGAPSRMEVLRAVPTSQPPLFNEGLSNYTHIPGPPFREAVDAMFAPIGGPVNGVPRTPAPVSRASRHLQVPVSEYRTAVTLQGLQLSSCSEHMLVPTPMNTPAATPRTSPTSLGRSSVSSPAAPPNTPTTPTNSPRRVVTTDICSDSTSPRRFAPAIFGSPLHPTRQRGGGPKKQKKAKMTKGKGKGKVSAKEKMLDDPAQAVANGESPVYSEDLVAILQHQEALAILSSAPGVEYDDVTALIKSGDISTAVAEFVENGKNGWNDPDWLEEALVASGRRATGDFDALLEDKFAETWEEDGGEGIEDEAGAMDELA